MRDVAGQALAFVQDLVPALLNFHTYTEQRIQIFPVDSAIDTISPLNQKVNTMPFVAMDKWEEQIGNLFRWLLCISQVLWETWKKSQAFIDSMANTGC